MSWDSQDQAARIITRLDDHLAEPLDVKDRREVIRLVFGWCSKELKRLTPKKEKK